MAWTNIPDSVLEPGKPIRSVDGLALRDNPVAIANGDAGAPRIQNAALATDSVTTDKIANFTVTGSKLFNGAQEAQWVGGRIAAMGLGAVGMIAFAKAVSGGAASPGTTREGSALRYTNIAGAEDTATALAGTWMCLGYLGNEGAAWLRVL